MRYEVIDYYKSQGFHIPDIIDKGKLPKWRVNLKQVEAACEYVYYQVLEGLSVDRYDLGRYTLNKAKKLRVGHYYKINLGDPVLLDDLTAIKTLECNLGQANITNVKLKHSLFTWKVYFLSLSSLVIGVIGNLVF